MTTTKTNNNNSNTDEQFCPCITISYHTARRTSIASDYAGVFFANGSVISQTADRALSEVYQWLGPRFRAKKWLPDISFSVPWFLQRVRIADNADRCNSHGSVRLSVRHVPVFCPDEWRYDHATFSVRTIILVSGQLKFIRIFAGSHPQRGR